MTPHIYVSESAYKDGYTDAYLELEGAPPLSIWDERVEHLYRTGSDDGRQHCDEPVPSRIL